MIGKFTEWLMENAVMCESNMGSKLTFALGSHNGGVGYYKKTVESLVDGNLVYLVGLDEKGRPTNDKSKNFITNVDFKDVKTLESFLNFAPQEALENYDLFNNCWNHTINGGARTSKYKDPIWKYIFKGQFSGGKGNNKGNAFEKVFADNFVSFMSGNDADETYVDAFKKILKCAGKTKKSFKSVEMEGKKNQKRSIMITDEDVRFVARNELVLNHKAEDKLDIGPTVTDVTINWVDGDKTYLSLKHGDTVEQVNMGISWARDDINALFSQVVNGDVELPDVWKLPESSNTSKFCKFLGVDVDKLMWSIWFADQKMSTDDRFVNARQQHKIQKDKKGQVDKKQKFTVKPGSPLYKFILDCVGYGYIYVHYNKGKIHIIDLTTPESIDRIFNAPIKAEVRYSNGESKTYVQIHLCSGGDSDFFNGIFEIRPNNGKLAFNVCNLKLKYNHENLEDVVKN